MNRAIFLLAPLIALSQDAHQSSVPAAEKFAVVGPSVLMNRAYSEEIQIVDLRPHGRKVPGAISPAGFVASKRSEVFLLGEPQTALSWAKKRDLKGAFVVPTRMLECENMPGVPQITPAEASGNGWPLFDVSEEFEFAALRLPRSQRLDFMAVQTGNSSSCRRTALSSWPAALGIARNL
jgi:hypothetical protein